MWTLEIYFDHQSGSRCWPSADPADSPYDTFTCRLCGFQFQQRMWGEFSMHAPKPMTVAESRMQEHLALWHRDAIMARATSEG